MHLNIEFKAKCKEPSKVREILEKYIVNCVGYMTFCTQFSNGKLQKECNLNNAVIHNAKFIEKDHQIDTYFSIDNFLDCVILFGKLTIRDSDKACNNIIGMLYNIKFHIDDVKDLGHFIEVEAIDKDGTIGEHNLRAQCSKYLEEFNIKEEDLVSCSYSDLLLQKIKERRV